MVIYRIFGEFRVENCLQGLKFSKNDSDMVISKEVTKEGLRSLINPFLNMEVHQLEEQPYHLMERYRQVERAEKLYQKFYNGLFPNNDLIAEVKCYTTLAVTTLFGADR